MNDKAAMATSCAKAARARLDSIILRRSLSGGRYATRRGAATGKAAAGREAAARLKQDQHWPGPRPRMTFVLSKIFWAIADPGNLLVLLLLAGLAWLAATHRRHGLGLGIIVAAMLGLVAISTLPLGAWALLPLESRFPVPQLPAQIDGIVVLGGAVEGRLSRDRGTIALNDAAERIFAAAILARRHPEAKILI